MAHGAGDLLVALVADEHDVVALGGELARLLVDLGHAAGRWRRSPSGRGSWPRRAPQGDAVGGEHHRGPLGHLVELVDEHRAPGLEVPDHVRVVDDLRARRPGGRRWPGRPRRCRRPARRRRASRGERPAALGRGQRGSPGWGGCSWPHSIGARRSRPPGRAYLVDNGGRGGDAGGAGGARPRGAGGLRRGPLGPLVQEVLGLRRAHEEIWGDFPAVLEANDSGVALFPNEDGKPIPVDDPMRHVEFRTSRRGLEGQGRVRGVRGRLVGVPARPGRLPGRDHHLRAGAPWAPDRPEPDRLAR